MTQFQLFVFLASAIYLAECLVIVRENGWLVLTWGKVFALSRGPKLHLRNPWPSGFVYKFPARAELPEKPLRLALSEAQARYQDFLSIDKTLRLWSRVLIGLGAFAFILFALRRGFLLAWGLWAFFFLFAHTTLVVSFWRGFGKLYPGAKWPRIRKTLLCAVSPWLSSRSMDLLADPLFEPFHPLVVGKLLLGQEAFKAWARRWLLELRYPPVLSGVPDVPLLLQKGRTEEEKDLVQWLKGGGLETASFLSPFSPAGPQDQSYCVRCEVAYQSKDGACKDCGRDLVPFEVTYSGVG